MGVPPAAPRWYVARAEAFRREIWGSPVRAVAPEGASAFVDEVARGPSLPKGEVRQLVDLVVVSAAWDVGWGCGREGGREQWRRPRDARSGRAGSADSACGHDPELGRGVARMTRAVRAKQYSIRTEQSYVDWCRSFLGVCGPRLVEQRGAAEVLAFLAHSSVERKVVAST